MDALVKSLFEYIQFIVLGALALAVSAYLMATWHPLARRLIRYIRGLGEFWVSGAGKIEELLLRWIKVGVIVGALYYLGVVTIVFSYWFVEPVRFGVLDCVYQEPFRPFAGECGGHLHPGSQAGELRFDRAWWLPVLGHAYSNESDANRSYLSDEAVVDNQDSKHIHDVLGDELTFARLLRVTAMFAFFTALVSAVKLIVVRVFRRSWLTNKSQYENFIDEKSVRLEEKKTVRSFERKNSNRYLTSLRKSVAWEHVMYPQIVILLSSIALYLFAMISYRTIEFEYASLVRDAAIEIRQHADPVSHLEGRLVIDKGLQ